MNQPPFPEMESQRFYERLRLIFEVRNMKILFCMTIQVFFMTKPNLKGSREFLKDIQIFQQDFNQMVFVCLPLLSRILDRSPQKQARRGLLTVSPSIPVPMKR